MTKGRFSAAARADQRQLLAGLDGKINVLEYLLGFIIRKADIVESDDALGDLKINGGSENAIYTKSLKVNGKDWDKAWIDYADWIDGGELTYKTATKPTSWATTILPPEFM